MSSRGTVVDDDSAHQGLSAEEAFALLPQVLDALAGAPWWKCSSDELTERVKVLARAENQVVAAQVTAVGEGLSCGLPALARCKTRGAWLRGLVPLTSGAATQRSALAQELPAPDLAPTRDAFAAGSIAVGHASVVSRTMTALDAVPEVDGLTWADAQRLLVDCAQRLDPAQLGRAGQHLRHRLDPQGPGAFRSRLAHHGFGTGFRRTAPFSTESRLAEIGSNGLTTTDRFVVWLSLSRDHRLDAFQKEVGHR